MTIRARSRDPRSSTENIAAKTVSNARRAAMVLRFDHVGFPEGTYDHLYSGWYMRYWDPMKKWAAQQG